MFRILLVLFGLLCTVAVHANWKTERESLDRVHKVDQFRIYYTFQGANALPAENRVDADGNGVPDYVENMATRLQAAAFIYSSVFGMKHPLQGRRYANRVRYIDVHLMDLDGSTGSTGDGIVEYDYVADPEQPVPATSMKLAVDLRADTQTPSHELFHAYQNGYTMFKNRWFTEGTSRWSEYVLERGTGSMETLPQDTADIQDLLDRTYSASGFWNRLAYLCDTNQGSFALPEIVQPCVSNNRVLEDQKIYGYDFMRVLLENLEAEDKKASQAFGYATYEWEEDAQKSARNNPYILCAVRDAMTSQCDAGTLDSREVSRFIDALDQYTGNQCR